MPEDARPSPLAEEIAMTQDAETWVPARRLLALTLGAFALLAALMLVLPA